MTLTRRLLVSFLRLNTGLEITIQIVHDRTIFAARTIFVARFSSSILIIFEIFLELKIFDYRKKQFLSLKSYEFDNFIVLK